VCCLFVNTMCWSGLAPCVPSRLMAQTCVRSASARCGFQVVAAPSVSCVAGWWQFVWRGEMRGGRVMPRALVAAVCSGLAGSPW
jgi:hypothetical protein